MFINGHSFQRKCLQDLQVEFIGLTAVLRYMVFLFDGRSLCPQTDMNIASKTPTSIQSSGDAQNAKK